MNLCDLNPHLRFAAKMLYDINYNDTAVQVSDCRLFLVLEGSASLSISGQQYALAPGCLFYCCAGSRYSIRTQNLLRLMILNFDLTQQANRHSLPLPPCRDPAKWDTMPVYYEAVADSPFLGSYLVLENQSHLHDPLSRLLEEFGSTSRYSRELCSAALKSLLIALHQADPRQIPPIIEQVQAYIQSHYAQPITNQELAKLAGYHPYHLNRVFTDYTGLTLHSYLLQLRLKKANHLILNTDMELQAIAEQVGFGSYPHFSSYFKQMYGCSPAQYRKRLRGSI